LFSVRIFSTFESSPGFCTSPPEADKSEAFIYNIQVSQSQSITLSTGLVFSLATTWRTSPKHHLPLGCLSAHRQLPSFFSIWIFFSIVDLPFLR
jgi:hypothetical protein